MQFTAQDLDQLQFDNQGLIPAVVQDAVSGRVLKLEYFTRKGLEKTIDTKKPYYKTKDGDSIHDKENLIDFAVDCSNKSLLIKVNLTGAACHNGQYSCYDNPAGEKDELKGNKSAILQEVFETIMQRKTMAPENSYVAKKMQEGIDRILKKVGEEAGEVIIAAKNKDAEEMGWEMADLIFHLWLVLGYYDLSPDIIYEKLMSRRK